MINTILLRLQKLQRETDSCTFLIQTNRHKNLDMTVVIYTYFKTTTVHFNSDHDVENENKYRELIKFIKELENESKDNS